MHKKTSEHQELVAPTKPSARPGRLAVTQTVAHAASQPSLHAQASGRPANHKTAGLHLLKRGSIFYFRRRNSARLRGLGASDFLCFSLRTHLRSEATKRAAALLLAVESAEREIMTKTQKDDLSPVEIKAILDEMVRAELQRIILDLDSPGPRTLQLIEERVRKLEAENATLREAAKLREYRVVEQDLLKAASNLGMKLEIPFSGALGRQALAKSRALKEAELRIEDGDDIANAAQSLIVDHLAGDLTKVDQVPLSLNGLPPPSGPG